ncbi:xylose ABC transporter membrane protein [Amphibacillus marinus]|uniref:Xylose transport system permease protein XylH n=1 Tax=Amphibacillus marinus TaxID=872970 RepID=A0A1H8N9I3_9BACI|nr:sugar ABC transporter permease [Amphibacillus marinus]SEO26270.1 xylose ABC transporter membrane protein [Amphibacillus marinus]
MSKLIKRELKDKLSLTINVQSYTLIIALIAIALIFTIFTNGEFLSPRNISNLFNQMAVISILAIGMTLIIVTGHIDLSVGSLAGLTGGVAAILQVWYGWHTVLVVIVAVLLGALLGLWQGWWVAYRAVPAFIVTLGGQLVFRGMLIGISQGRTIAPLDYSFRSISNSYLPFGIGYSIVIMGTLLIILAAWRNRVKRAELDLELNHAIIDYGKASFTALSMFTITFLLNLYYGVPLPLLIVTFFGTVFIFISNKTAFGRYIYAIGGNKEAAALSGINIKKHSLLVFVLMGALAGLAGIMLTSRLNAATVSAGDMYELDAIAACVIGGASLTGGKGKIVGAIIGALIMASIDNGMSMMNIQTFWQYIVKGLILIIAVWIDIANRKEVV